MKELIIAKTYEICKQVVSTKYPKELEILDLVWPQAKKVLNKIIDQDVSKWPTHFYVDEKSLGLAFTDPAAMKSAIKHIIFLAPRVLGDLLTKDLSTPEDVRRNIFLGLRAHGGKYSVPVHLVKHLEQTLPDLIIEIPEALADTVDCWKILPRGKRERISIRQARILPLKSPEYIVLINMLDSDKPVLHLDGERMTVREKAVKVLVSLLMKDGNICEYKDIVEYAWEEVLESLSTSEEDMYIPRIEKTINQALKKASPLFEKNISNVRDEGFKVEGDLLKYCILAKID